ncbi:MAG: hypothetical protein AAF937_08140 [Planctomycetota bacterium]
MDHEQRDQVSEAENADVLPGSGGDPTDVLADIEARARAVERAEASLTAREHELNETSAAMARELREAAEALRLQEQAFATRQAGASSNSSAGFGSGPSEVLVSRRARLQRIRKTLRDRASKLQRYEAVLDDRAAEADQILAQRREVSRAATAVQARERKLAAIQARNKTMSASFFVMAGLAILGVLSFAVADHVAPATYAAAAEIEIDGRGRDLSPDEIDEWQRYMAGLLMDPGLLEIASDRMRKRGLISLARAPELRARLQQDLTSATPSPGRLTVELVGEGSGPTRRALETYVVSLVAQSNATKQQRAGGTGSRVAADAAILDDPLADERITYAAGFGGGGAVVGLLIGSVVYRRLKAQHSRFEQGVID